MAAADLTYQHIFGTPPVNSSSSPSPPSSSSPPISLIQGITSRFSSPPTTASSTFSSSSPSLSSVDSSSSSADSVLTAASCASPTPDLSVVSTPPPRRPRSVVASFFSRSSHNSPPKPKKEKEKKPKQKSLKSKGSKARIQQPEPPICEEDETLDSPADIEASLNCEFPSPPLGSSSSDFPDTMQQQQQAYYQQLQMQQQMQLQMQQMQQQIQHQMQQAQAQAQQQAQYGASTPVVLNRPQRISSSSPAQQRQHYQQYQRQASPQRIPQLPRQQQPKRPVSNVSSNAPRGRTASHGSSASFDSILSGSSPAPGSDAPSSRPSSSQTQGHGHHHYRPGQPFHQPLLDFSVPAPRPRSYEEGQQFALLPGEVLELILDELKNLHLRPGSDSCASCWARDLCSVALASRKWSKFARTSLYEDIRILGIDPPALKKRYKTFEFPRLALLRRTLRSSQQIAVIVKTLRVPVLTPGMNKESYYNTVASVIMACPNFEHLPGLLPAYDHSFNRLFHALSSRPKLKQMDWILDRAAQTSPPSRPGNSRGSQLRSRLAPLTTAPADLSVAQTSAWAEWHCDWSHLTTLTIHGMPGGALAPENLVIKAVEQLPKLQHLFLSSLPSSALDDDSIQSLPALQTLSMTRLDGISNRGLTAFAARSESRSIKRLELRHLKIDNMATLCRVFASFSSLEKLVFVQGSAPVMPADDMFCLMPYAASSSLRSLHWDITMPADPLRASPSDSIMARSIAAGGFPALRSIRAPADPEGVFQALCQVYERIDLARDRFRNPGQGSISDSATPSAVANLRSPPITPATPTLSKSSTGSTTTTTTGLATPTGSNAESVAAEDVRPATNLSDARRLAQTRLENAQRFPRYFAHIVDERGRLAEKIGLGGFMGDLRSKIRYNLLPDAGASDADAGLLDIGRLLAARDAEIAGQGEFCTGRWNIQALHDKKDKERWSHADRPRWIPLDL